MNTTAKRMIIVCSALLAGVMTGCNIVGPAMILAKGPPSQAARHELNGERPTVVLIDDRLPRLGRRQLRNIIAESCQRTLLEQNILKSVIDYRAAFTIADRESPGQPLDIVTIARTVGAEIVVFATVDEFFLTPDGETMAPNGLVRVKVLDTTKESPRVWPAESEGFPLKISFNQRATPLPRTPSDIMIAENKFADQVGRAIAKLFFTHEIRESVGNR